MWAQSAAVFWIFPFSGLGSLIIYDLNAAQFYKKKLWRMLSDTVASFKKIFWERSMKLLALLSSVTLKNAAELLEFAAMYNAEQLKLSCLQFIVLNMAALLESK